MKKILLTIVLFCTTTFMYAQDNKWEFGIEGGPNLDYVWGLPTVSITLQPAYFYSAGISGQYNITKKFSIKSGLVFEKKGNLEKYNSTSSDSQGNAINSKISDEFNLNYLVIPVMAKYCFGNNIKFFVNGGPYFGYLLNASEAFLYQVNSGAVQSNISDRTQDFKHFDFGLSAGIGAEKLITQNMTLSLEVRSDMGIINIGFGNNPPGTEFSYETWTTALLLELRYNL